MKFAAGLMSCPKYGIRIEAQSVTLRHEVESESHLHALALDQHAKKAKVRFS